MNDFALGAQHRQEMVNDMLLAAVDSHLVNLQRMAATGVSHGLISYFEGKTRGVIFAAYMVDTLNGKENAFWNEVIHSWVRHCLKKNIVAGVAA